ncbi:hypothetical protein P4V88_21715, partial [Bacillus thuringiensis]|nr:hypothetical protein [Bacillus thuringiensis]
MLVRLGYVAMSVHLKNASPSQTMTYAQFQKIDDRDAAIRKLERIANSNLENCLRLLKHNKGHDISFFRLSSKNLSEIYGIICTKKGVSYDTR